MPTIRSIDDTSNFEELEAKAPDPGHLIRQSMRKEANKGFSGKDLPFIGFTYTRSLSDLESEKAKENNGYDTSVKGLIEFLSVVSPVCPLHDQRKQHYKQPSEALLFWESNPDFLDAARCHYTI